MAAVKKEEADTSNNSLVPAKAKSRKNSKSESAEKNPTEKRSLLGSIIAKDIASFIIKKNGVSIKFNEEASKEIY